MKRNILKLSALLIIGTFLVTSCSKEEATTTTPTPTAEKNIVQLAEADTTLSILVAALKKTGLVTTLQAAGTFTVFAPTNDAFRKDSITAELVNSINDPMMISELREALLFHVLGSKVLSTQLSNTYLPSLSKVNNNAISLQVAIAPVKINNEASVVSADINASNGVIHKIDRPLNAPTVMDIALNNSNFTTLVSALKKAELEETFYEGENLTVFAPINKAFSDINFDLNSSTKTSLTPILTGHVLGSLVRSSAITNGLKATTLNENVQLTFSTTAGVKFNGGKTTDISVTTADIQATNGVVHVIDKVILPN